MMGRFLAAAVLAAAAATMPGCAFHRVEINDPTVAQKARQIVPGVTRQSEIDGILGVSPTNFISLPDGGVLLTYVYGQSKTGGLNLILFNTMKTNSGLDTAFVMVDPGGVVRKIWIGDHSEDVPWEWWAFGD